MKTLLSELEAQQHKPSWIKRLIKWVALCLLILIVGNSLILMMGRAIGKVLILEFFLALSPSKSMNGINILAFGIDDTRAIKRSDTIIVFHLDQ